MRLRSGPVHRAACGLDLPRQSGCGVVPCVFGGRVRVLGGRHIGMDEVQVDVPSSGIPEIAITAPNIGGHILRPREVVVLADAARLHQQDDEEWHDASNSLEQSGTHLLSHDDCDHLSEDYRATKHLGQTVPLVHRPLRCNGQCSPRIRHKNSEESPVFGDDNYPFGGSA